MCSLCPGGLFVAAVVATDPPSRQVALRIPLQLRMLSRVRVQRYTTQKDTLT